MRTRVMLRTEDVGDLLCCAEIWVRRENRDHPDDRVPPKVMRALERVRASLYATVGERDHEPTGYCQRRKA